MLAAVSVSAHDNNDKDRDRNDSYGEHLVKLGYALVPPGVKLNLQGKNRALEYARSPQGRALIVGVSVLVTLVVIRRFRRR